MGAYVRYGSWCLLSVVSRLELAKNSEGQQNRSDNIISGEWHVLYIYSYCWFAFGSLVIRN